MTLGHNIIESQEQEECEGPLGPLEILDILKIIIFVKEPIGLFKAANNKGSKKTRQTDITL